MPEQLTDYYGRMMEANTRLSDPQRALVADAARRLVESFPPRNRAESLDWPRALRHFRLPSLASLSRDEIEARWRAGHLLTHAVLHGGHRCSECMLWPDQAN